MMLYGMIFYYTPNQFEIVLVCIVSIGPISSGDSEKTGLVVPMFCQNK